jgi:hypothetical protein
MRPKSPDAPWARKGWFRRWADYSTLLMACCWGGLFLLWPEMPQTDMELVPHLPGIVVAHDLGIPVSDIHRRPDLIAFSSDISFSASEEDARLPVGVVYDREGGTRILMRERRSRGDVVLEGAVALAAEAVRDVGGVESPLRELRRNVTADVASPTVSVDVSTGLGGAVLAWSEGARQKLFAVESAWEVELSLSITDDGRPVDVFLEASSGSDAIDRAVVMAVSRPDAWRQASRGHGTVLISFSPTHGVWRHR